jgi:hypothetical protein
VWVTREGDEESIEVEPGAYIAPRVEPSGRRILLPVFYESNNAIWMHDTVRGVTSRVRQGAGDMGRLGSRAERLHVP